MQNDQVKPIIQARISLWWKFKCWIYYYKIERKLKKRKRQDLNTSQIIGKKYGIS